MCDETNNNRVGAVLLYSFLKVIGKTELVELDQAGIKSEFLASNPVLLRELVDSKFNDAVRICEEHAGEPNYDLLKVELQQN